MTLLVPISPCRIPPRKNSDACAISAPSRVCVIWVALVHDVMGVPTGVVMMRLYVRVSSSVRAWCCGGGMFGAVADRAAERGAGRGW